MQPGCCVRSPLSISWSFTEHGCGPGRACLPMGPSSSRRIIKLSLTVRWSSTESSGRSSTAVGGLAAPASATGLAGGETTIASLSPLPNSTEAAATRGFSFHWHRSHLDRAGRVGCRPPWIFGVGRHSEADCTRSGEESQRTTRFSGAACGTAERGTVWSKVTNLPAFEIARARR